MGAVALTSGTYYYIKGHTQGAGEGQAGVVGQRSVQPLGMRGLCRRPLDRGGLRVVSERLKDAVQPEACPQVHQGRHVGGSGRIEQHRRQGRFGMGRGEAAEQAQGGQAETGGYWLC